MKYGLSDEQLKEVTDVLASFSEIDSAVLFGSRVLDTFKEASDVDIAIKGKKADYGLALKVQGHFEETNLPFYFDVIAWSTIKSDELKKHIKVEGQMVYRKGWKEVKLGDIIKFGNGNVKPDMKGTIPIYGENGILDYTSINNYDGETIIIGRVGAYCGSVYFENKPIWISDNALSAKPKKNDNAKYLFYLLKNIILNNKAEGSSQPLITQTILNSINSMFCKNKIEQNNIVEVLSSLDEKIDLLHRQNKTLEDMAQVLFRKWFVEGENEKWRTGLLADVIDLKYGKTLKESERSGKGFPVVGSNGIIGHHSNFLINSPGIVIGRKGSLGKTTYLWDNFFPIDTTFYIESKINSIGLFFEYFLLKNIDFKSMNSDSAVTGLNRNIALQYKVKIPPHEMLKNFNQKTVDFFKKIAFNKNQIKRIENLRNMVLPKLMEGNISVL